MTIFEWSKNPWVSSEKSLFVGGAQKFKEYVFFHPLPPTSQCGQIQNKTTDWTEIWATFQMK